MGIFLVTLRLNFEVRYVRFMKNNFWKITASIFLMLPLHLFAQKSNFSEGFLDLRHWDFNQKPILSLEGNWDFYWKKLYFPNDFDTLTEKAVRVEIPKTWNNQILNDPAFKGEGYATYRLRILLPSKRPHIFALKLLTTMTSSTWFVNGKKLIEKGKVAKQAQDSKPDYSAQVVRFSFPSDTLDVVVHVSNFFHRKGGFSEAVEFGLEEPLRNKRDWLLYISFFMSGSILIMGFYHIGLYLIRRHDLSPLYFGIFCFLVFVRLICTGEYVVDLLFEFDWHVKIASEYLSFYLSIGCFMLFMGSIYPQEINSKIRFILVACSASFSLFVLIFPPKIYSHTTVTYEIITLLGGIYVIYLLIVAIKRKRQGGWALLFGFIFMFATAINDMLYSNGILLSTANTAMFGLFVFIFSQAFLLSSRFSQALIQTQELSQVLDYQNKNLEKIVGQRTDQIQQQNNDLQFLNQLIEEEKEKIAMQSSILQAANEQLAKTQQELQKALLDEQNSRSKLQETLQKLQNAQVQLIQSEKMASLGVLTAGIAHEINNPINFIYAGINSLKTNMLDLMKVVEQYEQVTPENATAHLAKIERLKRDLEFRELKKDLFELISDIEIGANRTAEIVKGLRIFSRLDETSIKRADLHENINSTLIILNSQVKGRIEIVKNYAENIPLIECNIGQINQVVMNIISNAIQATEDEGTITITTELLQEQNVPFVRLSLSDTGSGMPEEVKKHIFEPFFTTKEIGKGTGLGLAISYSVIEKHKGKIEVESVLGQGTTFIITLPISQ